MRDVFRVDERFRFCPNAIAKAPLFEGMTGVVVGPHMIFRIGLVPVRNHFHSVVSPESFRYPTDAEGNRLRSGAKEHPHTLMVPYCSF